jgi:hypothetical protein
MENLDETSAEEPKAEDDFADFNLIDWNTAWDAEDKPCWFVEPFIAEGRGHVVYAQAKEGKSFFVLSVAAGIATGRQTLDQPAGEPRSVLYLDYEMTMVDVTDRLIDFGYGPEGDLTNLHYALLPTVPPLDTESGGRRLLAVAQHVGAELVIVDTTSRAVAGEENSADTFQDLYRYTGTLLKREGIAYLRIDHAGKEADRGQRGSSAKNDDVDLIWQYKSTDSGAKLAGIHRPGWVPHSFAVRRIDDNERIEFEIDRSDQDYLPGTKERAALLDSLDIPRDWGRDKVRAVLKTDGHSITNAILSSAIRYRKAAESKHQ